MKGSGGVVTFNKKAREQNLINNDFRRLTSYIMQDDTLRTQLTTIESMTFVAKMKLGSDFSDAFRTSFVNIVTIYLQG